MGQLGMTQPVIHHVGVMPNPALRTGRVLRVDDALLRGLGALLLECDAFGLEM